MVKIFKNFDKIKKEKYTILIVPNNTKNTRHFVFSKIAMALSLIFTFVVIASFFILYGLYSYEKKANKILSESNKQNKYQLNATQQDIKDKQMEVDTYKNSIANIKDKVDELNDLESKINSILGSGAIKFPTSRGGAGINPSTTSLDLDGSINKLKDSLSKLQAYELAQRKIPSVLPCAGNFTSKFGIRSNPFSIRSSETHPGIDIAGSIGTPIKASADGVVTYSGWESGYGNVIKINHGNGYESFYGHNSKLLVNEGTQVKRGDVIALMGSTGRSTGTHCHFEVRLNGNPIDPLKLVKQ